MTNKGAYFNRGQGMIGKVQKPSFQKGSAAFLDDFTVGPTLYPAVVRLTDKDCWQLYKGNDWIYAVVDRIVADCVKVEPKVLPKEDGKEISGRLEKRIREVEAFLTNPNVNKEPFFEIREKIIRDMLVMGRGTVEKVLSFSRKLKEIYGTSPEYIRIQSDNHGNLSQEKTYVLRHWRNNVPIYFDIDQMIFMVHRPISKSAYGLRVLDAIANTVASDILRANYNGNFFINGAEAAGIIGLEGMNNKELQKFRSYWRENFRGAKNAHKTAAVNVPVKYVRMAITNRDLEFTEYGKELRTKIFAAYGMLPFIMGINDESMGKMDPSTQVQIYKDGALKPILMKESYYYTEEIVRMGFGYDDIVISFPSIDLLDFANQAKTDLADVNAGLRTINEVRSQRGHGHVPWGDTPISVMPGGGQVDPKSGKLIPPSKTTGGATKKPAAKKPKKSLSEQVAITKIKIQALLDNCGEIKLDENLKFEKSDFTTRRIPKELQKLEFDQHLNQCMYSYYDYDVQGTDPRWWMWRMLECEMKYVIYSNIMKGTIENIMLEIDKIVDENKDEAIVQENL